MYIPWNWLKKQVEFPKNTSPWKIAQKLTELGLETETDGQIWQFTPLPNRLDLFSWWGIAQEISILLNYPLSTTKISQQKRIKSAKPEAKWGKIIVETPNCLQIELALIQNVKFQQSPSWIKDYLTSNKIIPVNQIIDIANLVMLEAGQPLLAYDYDKLPSKEIIVRSALEKEKILTASGKELILNSQDTVVSTGKKIISLAGIINSQAALVDNKTTNILIESSRFSPESVEKTIQRLSISTLSSQYSVKKINLPFGNYALRRAIELIKEINLTKGKEKIIGWYAMTAKKIIPKTISINLEFIEKKLGLKLNPTDLEKIFKRLDFSFKKEKSKKRCFTKNSLLKR